uniref:Solute carrier family 25 member 32b n=1 Tax=Sinocyclocheilus grahami TaxID=75366 RepID=A0A672KFF2_SINGR
MTQREPLRTSNDSFHVDLGFTSAAVHLLYIRFHCFLGAVTLCLTNPIWVTKTRLVLQYSADPSKKQYKGMMDALVKIFRHEGIAGLYRGFVPGLFGTSHGALQFMAYEELKRDYNKYRKMQSDAKLVSMSMVPNLIRVTPACCITFVVYENVSRFLLDQEK